MVYILLADGFEEAEALVPCDILRRGGVEVKLVGTTGPQVTGAHGIWVLADCTLDQVEPEQIELLMLPGGLAGVDRLYANRQVQTLIQKCYDGGVYVAAICAAPTILGAMGLLDRRRAVCYPGMEEGLGSAVVCKGSQAVVDGRIITGEGPGSAYEFGYQLLESLKGKEAMEQVKHAMHFHH